MTNRDAESKIKSLKFIEKILTVIAIIFFVVGFLALFANVLIGLILIIIGVIFVVLVQKYYNQTKKLLDDYVIKDLLYELLGDDAKYDRNRIVNIGPMVFPFRYGSLRDPNSREGILGEDCIEANYKGMNFAISDIWLRREDIEMGAEGEERGWHTVFRGQWLLCDFKKPIASELYISAYPSKDNTLTTDFTIGNREFDKKFCIKAKDEEAARAMLTPDMIELILDLADKNSGDFYMSFLPEGKANVALNNGKDMFELNDKKIDTQLIKQQFTNEIKFFIDFAESLSKQDSLFK